METDVCISEPHSFIKRRPEDNEDWPLDTTASLAEDRRRQRQSLRLRPSQHFENAGPPSPLKDLSLKSESEVAKPSRMSLFSLFSRPKVEKQRGYAERGLEVPVSAHALPSKDRRNASAPNLVVHVQPGNGESALQAPPLPSPTPTAPVNSATRVKFSAPARLPSPLVRERRSGPFDPPPLFQAYPQSTKSGVLELSLVSVESAHHKVKGRRGDAKERMTEESASIATSRTRMTMRSAVGNVSMQAELPRKIFVLVTAGFLLQYAEHGPSNRLPERVLMLGKDSAAFASDLLPGRHHVLQVSHAVDHNGAAVPTGGSIFSKLGLRSAATKRTTSSFLLVMPSAMELGSWMTAIKREIEVLGGQQDGGDTVQPATQHSGSSISDLATPSSHRYQVKRNPSKVERLEIPEQSLSRVSPILPEDNASSDSDAATIEGIEREALKLDEDGKASTTRARALSDVASLSSSTAVSVDQVQLNNIRRSESICNSSHTSSTSYAGTVSSPIATPPAVTITDSPLAGRAALDSGAETRDNPAPLKSVSRSLSSYSTKWRRSGVPLAMQKSGTLPPALNISPHKKSTTIAEESSTVAKTSPPSTESSPKKSLSATRSEPDLHSASRRQSKRDSKLSPLPPVPTIPAIPSAPLPQLELATKGSLDTGWSPSSVPARRTSLQPLVTQMPANNQVTTRNYDGTKNKRISFSMPLKVNPSGVHTQSNSSGNNRRASQLHDPDTAGDSPTVYTLEAKVEPRSRPSLLISAPPDGPPRSNDELTTVRQISNPRTRYSLLPEALPLPPTPSPTGYVRRAPSPTMAAFQQAQGDAVANSKTLKRPTSMQVHSDPAPFLASVRTAGQIDARAIPIRGMKPSRSATNVAALAQTNAFRGMKPTTPMLQEEADDQPTPLPDRSVSPLPAGPASRTNSRRALKTRSSLPELDLGMPVVGLGPPAPPPNAPLPLPPPGSRTTSPIPLPLLGTPFPSPPSGIRTKSPSPSRPPTSSAGTAGIEAVAGLGIRVS